MDESGAITYTQIDGPTSSIEWSRENHDHIPCRLCGNTNEYMISIFTGEGIEHQLEYKINSFLPIKVSHIDSLTHHVCYSCASTLIAFSTLSENCQQVEKKLMSNSSYCENEKRDGKENENETENVYRIVGTSFEVDGLPNEERQTSIDVSSKLQTETNIISPESVTEEKRVGHNNDLKVIKKQRKRKKQSLSTCLICGKVFNFLEYLKTHLLIHSENRPHLCHICGATFKRKDHVNHHRRTVHITHRDVIRELGAKGEEPLTCEICGDVKPTKHAMQVHKKKHNKTCVCDVCDQSFSLPSLLKYHLIRDHAEEVCKCNICGDTLKSGHSLYLHKKKHSTSYICDVCGKSFSLPSSLRTHMVIHSDDKPFTCDECGKSFKLRGRLQLHKKNHGNIRPYACNICENKRFKTKSALIVHNNMHNDTRLYPCPHCNFRARKNSDLVCHIRTHTGEKPYKCDVCGRGFAQAGDMRKHKTTHEKQKIL